MVRVESCHGERWIVVMMRLESCHGEGGEFIQPSTEGPEQY